VLLAAPAFAQLPSAASLTGDYYARYISVNTTNAATLSWGGKITFDGKGGFALSGNGASSAVASKTFTPLTSGSYNVLPNGMLYIANPFDTSSAITSNSHIFLYGGLGAGIVTASSTEDIFCDLFIAIPASTANSAASLNGTYQVASLEFLNGDFAQTRDTFFTMAADGKGGLGNVTVKGTAQSFNGTAQAQTSSGATYTVTADGSGTLVLPAPSGIAAGSVLLSGNKILWTNADGSIFLAGATNGFDLVVGVKQSSAANFSGLYFTGYLENFAVGSNNDGVYSSSGASNALSTKTEIAHNRVNSELFYPYDYTFSNPFSFSADGTSPNSNFAVGANGNILLGAGSGNDYQLVIYAKSVAISSTGSVFLNPQGIVNAANNVPFTAQFSPGEVVTLFGSGFSSQTLTTPGVPWPTTLGGAQVSITYSDANSNPVTVQAPIYFVSASQINVVVPYTVPNDGRFLTFKVTANGTDSNSVPVYSGPTSPGIFTVPSGGIGNGAILHADFSLVSSSSPAKSGETVQIFLTGLGAVNSNVAAGSAGPSNPLANSTLPVSVILYDSNGKSYTTGKVQFQGLAPVFGGLYQVNFTLPTGLPTGTMSIEIYVGDGSDYGDGDNIMATIPIG